MKKIINEFNKFKNQSNLEYGSDEERKQLFRKFPELMFGLLPPALVGGSLLED